MAHMDRPHMPLHGQPFPPPQPGLHPPDRPLNLAPAPLLCQALPELASANSIIWDRRSFPGITAAAASTLAAAVCILVGMALLISVPCRLSRRDQYSST